MLGPDRDFAQLLRRRAKKVILVVNKCEGRGAKTADAFYALGLGEPIPISAEHGEGLGDLYAALAPFLTEAEETPSAEEDSDEAEVPIDSAARSR